MTDMTLPETLVNLLPAYWPQPEYEYRFHPERRWRLDLVYFKTREYQVRDGDGNVIGESVQVEPGVAVECHGGTYTHGRHTRGKGFENDREKMNEAQLLGWIVLEFTSNQILKNPGTYCGEQIKRALKMKGIM